MGTEQHEGISLPVDDVKLTVSLVDTLHGIRSDLATGLGRVEAVLVGKADKSDVDRVVTKLEGHDTRISRLERDKEIREERAKVHEQRDETARLSNKAKTGLAIAGITAASSFVFTLFSIFHP